MDSPIHGGAKNGNNDDDSVTSELAKGGASCHNSKDNSSSDHVMPGGAIHEEDIPIAHDVPEYELNQLRRLNREKADIIDGEGKAIHWLVDLCSQFLDTCDEERLYHLMRTWDAQAVIKDLQGAFYRLFTGLTSEEFFEINGRQVQAQDYYTIALELLALGVISHPNNNPRAPYHTLKAQFVRPFARAISALNTAACAKVDRYIDRETKAREDAISRADEERCEAIEKFTEHKEHDLDLAPAEKARVFMNALRARNDRGWLVTHWEPAAYPTVPAIASQVHNHLIFHLRDRGLAEDFFTDHPQINVAELMGMIEDCVDVYRREPELKPNDPLWHVKQGRTVPFLLRHASNVAEELDSEKGTQHQRMF